MNKEKGDRATSVIIGWYRLAYFYDAFAKLLLFFVGGEKTWRQNFINLVEPKPGEDILELCCGTGTLAMMIAENRVNGPKVQGSDLSPDQIDVARRKARRKGLAISFSAKDASDTDCPGASFDKIVIMGALYEIRGKKRREIYEEVRRLLKPTGRFYVSEPDRPGNRWGAFCLRVFTGITFPARPTTLEIVNGGLEREIEDAGFKLEEKRHSNFGTVQHLRFRQM